MIIANFTPDSIDWMHAGINGVLEPNSVKEFDEARGNHVLNEYTPRGLLRLEYNDDPDIKKREAMTIYERFWEKQIVVFNQHNERLKNENKAYVMATPQLIQKAKEFGIELVGPWKLKLPAQDKEIEKLKKENRELGSKMDALQDRMTELLDVLANSVKTTDVEELPDEAPLEKAPRTSLMERLTEEKEKYMKHFKNKGKSEFRAWFKQNIDLVKSWPEEIRDEVHMKYLSYGYDEPWSLEE